MTRAWARLRRFSFQLHSMPFLNLLSQDFIHEAVLFDDGETFEGF